MNVEIQVQIRLSISTTNLILDSPFSLPLFLLFFLFARRDSDLVGRDERSDIDLIRSFSCFCLLIFKFEVVVSLARANERNQLTNLTSSTDEFQHDKFILSSLDESRSSRARVFDVD